MSRIAKNPIELPKGVEVTINGQEVSVKGPKGALTYTVHSLVNIEQEDGVIRFSPIVDNGEGWAQAATSRTMVYNRVVGVSEGFERKLQLNGVGYRAQAQGKVLNLTLGFSHPIAFELPEGVTAETPTQTEIVLRGVDKQVLGQAAANIRAFRPPEPYKGKGVRYADEQVRRKEAKKG
ncbi:MAG TPA: 50S ribosomal protein L6 [Alcanivoracaceae bacterium]|nr:50S ribosomal protein L6 [Alcanivoracaceae bacterium]